MEPDGEPERPAFDEDEAQEPATDAAGAAEDAPAEGEPGAEYEPVAEGEEADAEGEAPQEGAEEGEAEDQGVIDERAVFGDSDDEQPDAGAVEDGDPAAEEGGEAAAANDDDDAGATKKKPRRKRTPEEAAAAKTKKGLKKKKRKRLEDGEDDEAEAAAERKKARKAARKARAAAAGDDGAPKRRKRRAKATDDDGDVAPATGDGGDWAGSDDDDDGGAPARPPPPADDDKNEFERITRTGKAGRKKKAAGPALEDVRATVERFIVRMEMAAERDDAAVRAGTPAVAKLRMLAEAEATCSRRSLQEELLSSGLMAMLALWLKPLPDGSLPNATVRTKVLSILGKLPIDLDLPDRKEQMKKAGLGKVIMFLSKTPDETADNRRAAQALVENWMRPIYALSTRFEDLRRLQEEAPLPASRQPKAAPQATKAEQDDLYKRQARLRPGEFGYRYSAEVPKPLAMEYVRRPQAAGDDEDGGGDEAEEARAPGVGAGGKDKDGKHARVARKLDQLKKPVRKNERAAAVSVQGGGMFHG